MKYLLLLLVLVCTFGCAKEEHAMYISAEAIGEACQGVIDKEHISYKMKERLFHYCLKELETSIMSRGTEVTGDLNLIQSRAIGDSN